MRMIINFFIATAFCGIAHASGLSRIDFLSKKSSFNNGPNCFNAALFAAGVIEDQVEISAQEISFYVQSHCEEVNWSHSKSGDILLYIDGASTHRTAGWPEINKVLHAGYSLGHDMVFEKNSTDGTKPN